MNGEKRIALIEAGWHKQIVDQCYVGLAQVLAQHHFDVERVDRYAVPGSLEIPLAAKKLSARQGQDSTRLYSVIIASGLIVDGGIYRHDFVANAVLQGMMQVQLECEIPILSVVLTPHQFHDHQTHQRFFMDHMLTKGQEAGLACLQLVNSAMYS